MPNFTYFALVRLDATPIVTATLSLHLTIDACKTAAALLNPALIWITPPLLPHLLEHAIDTISPPTYIGIEPLQWGMPSQITVATSIAL